MSHFTRMKTQMVKKEYLKQALTELGYACQEGPVEIRGFGGNHIRVDSRLPPRTRAMPLAFRRRIMPTTWWRTGGVSATSNKRSFYNR
jgi:hypothetical protein